jgi:hypothetical protein
VVLLLSGKFWELPTCYVLAAMMMAYTAYGYVQSYGAWLLDNYTRPDDDVQDRVAHLINTMHTDHDDEVKVREDGEPQPRRRGLAMIRACVQQVKFEFGTPSDNKANRECVRQRVVRWMQEHGHRPSHIARDWPIAASMVFAPTPSEITAAWMERTDAYQAARNLMEELATKSH